VNLGPTVDVTPRFLSTLCRSMSSPGTKTVRAQPTLVQPLVKVGSQSFRPFPHFREGFDLRRTGMRPCCPGCSKKRLRAAGANPSRATKTPRNREVLDSASSFYPVVLGYTARRAMDRNEHLRVAYAGIRQSTGSSAAAHAFLDDDRRRGPDRNPGRNRCVGTHNLILRVRRTRSVRGCAHTAGPSSGRVVPPCRPIIPAGGMPASA